MARLIRMFVLLVILTTIVLPLVVYFLAQFKTPDISSAVTTFLSYTSSFFQNVRGLINYVVSIPFGNAGISTISFLIYWSWFLPLFGLASRFYLFLRFRYTT